MIDILLLFAHRDAFGIVSQHVFLSDNSAFDLSLPTRSDPASPPALQSSYPDVKFWYKHQWQTYVKDAKATSAMKGVERGRVRAAQGENVMLLYVEDEHGSPVDGYRASKVRKFARSIWVALDHAGQAPQSWTKVKSEAGAHYRKAMAWRFPELRLCDSDWKADQVAIDNYPSWRANYHNLVKEEDVSDVDEGLGNQVVRAGSKRLQNRSTSKAKKKLRAGSSVSTPVVETSAIPRTPELLLAPTPTVGSTPTEDLLDISAEKKKDVGLLQVSTRNYSNLFKW